MGYFGEEFETELRKLFQIMAKKTKDEKIQLFDAHGKRLYLTEDERQSFLKTAFKGDRHVLTFCATLYYTGCRISEALELTPKRIDLSSNVIIFESLKKRRRGVFRAVPVPSEHIDALNMVHAIRDAQNGQKKTQIDIPLWDWSRTTAWRRVKEVMDASDIQKGPHLCPKGLRHGYGIHAIGKGIPLNMLQKWMGHAQMETTSIYANAVGEEQSNIAAKMWS